MDWPVLLRGGLVTLEIAGGSWVVSVGVGLIIVALRETGVKIIDRVLSFIVTVIRAVPELVLLYIVYFGLVYVGIRLHSLPAAIAALGVSEAAFTSEYFRAALMTVSGRQRQAARSLGMSTAQSFRYIVLPQALPVAFPSLVNCFVGLLKTATLASAVSAPEILYQAQNQMTQSGQILSTTLAVVVIYVLATIPLTAAAGHLEARARRRMAS